MTAVVSFSVQDQLLIHASSCRGFTEPKWPQRSWPAHVGCIQPSDGTQPSSGQLHLELSPCCWLILQWHVQVGVDLGATGYLKDITAATSDISVQVIFCNAGYMSTGFFERR